MSDATQLYTATIANGASLSAEVTLGLSTLVGILMPAAWTSAALTFQAAEKPAADGGTYANLYDTTGTEVNYTVAASRYIPLDPSVFAGIRNIKLRSGTSGAAVTQGQAAAIVLITRPVG